ncbi:hypothetical protein AB0O20_36220 [Streptomyces kronopolitis]|uniref:hypothetical protein n=1 Tax=Streptomyces kronopolitis TaxID=1612435 RepID=UPI00341202B7
MTSETVTLTTGHVTAALTLPCGVRQAATAVGRLLPGGWSTSLTAPVGDGPRLLVDITQGLPGVEVAIGATTVRLRLTRSGAASTTLGYSTYTALERARQQMQLATVHASAVCGPNGQAVLVLGNKGAGKTSTVLALAARGFTHMGDDLVVLGERDGTVTVLPGKRTAAVRPADPALGDAPKPVVELRPFRDTPAPLGQIVRVTVHPRATEARLTRATPFSGNEYLRLHENLARYISGIPTPLDGIAEAPYGRVWPLDTPACARWRCHFISLLESSRFDYLYAPDPERAADLIATAAEVPTS